MKRYTLSKPAERDLDEIKDTSPRKEVLKLPGRSFETLKH